VGEKHKSTTARADDALRSCQAQSSSKQAAAGDTRLAADNHNGHSAGIPDTQNLVSELRHLVKRGSTGDRVHNQEAVRGAHVLVAYGVVFLLQKSQEENKSEQLAAIGASTETGAAAGARAHLSISVIDFEQASVIINGDLLAVLFVCCTSNATTHRKHRQRHATAAAQSMRGAHQ